MPSDALTPLAQALVRGDWRSASPALFGGQRLGGTRETADIVTCLRYVTLSMRAQCASSDVAQAKQHLDAAAQLLASPTPHTQSLQPDMEQLRRLTRQLVEREQADLLAVHRIFSISAKGQEELVHAYVEYLIWVSLDPYTIFAPGDDMRVLGLTAEEYRRFRPVNRKELIARANRLRQFAAARSGPLSVKAWPRIGGAGVLEAEGLRTLAREPLMRRHHALPVRRARQLACAYARAVVKDVG